MFNLIRYAIFSRRLKEVAESLKNCSLGEMYFSSNSFEDRKRFLLKVNGFKNNKDFRAACLGFGFDKRLNFLLEKDLPNFDLVKKELLSFCSENYSSYVYESILKNKRIVKELNLNDVENYQEGLALYEMNYKPLSNPQKIIAEFMPLDYIEFCYNKEVKRFAFHEKVDLLWSKLIKGKESPCYVNGGTMQRMPNTTNPFKFGWREFGLTSGFYVVATDTLAEISELVEDFAKIRIIKNLNSNNLMTLRKDLGDEMEERFSHNQDGDYFYDNVIFSEKNENKMKNMIISSKPKKLGDRLSMANLRYVIIDGLSDNFKNLDDIEFFFELLAPISMQIRSLNTVFILNGNLESLVPKTAMPSPQEQKIIELYKCIRANSKVFFN